MYCSLSYAQPQRSRSSISPQGVCSTTCFAWFWVSFLIWERWSFPLSFFLELCPSCTCRFTGCFLRCFSGLRGFYIKNGWQRIRDSIVKSNFQTAVIAFFVFELILPLKIKKQADCSYFFRFRNLASLIFLTLHFLECLKERLGFVVSRKTVIIGHITH